MLRALGDLPAANQRLAAAVLKLDRGVSGLGNALLDVEAAPRGLLAARWSWRTRKQSRRSSCARSPTRAASSRSGSTGRTSAARACRCRISPSGQVEILSTHDQVLGGPHGQTYFGCRFPADPEYAAPDRRRRAQGRTRLARGRDRPCGGRLRRSPGRRWLGDLRIEINLRCGGTARTRSALSKPSPTACTSRSRASSAAGSAI